MRVSHRACFFGVWGLTDLTGLAFPLWRTQTLEAVFQVDARPALSTGAGGTFVHV